LRPLTASFSRCPSSWPAADAESASLAADAESAFPDAHALSPSRACCSLDFSIRLQSYQVQEERSILTKTAGAECPRSRFWDLRHDRLPDFQLEIPIASDQLEIGPVGSDEPRAMGIAAFHPFRPPTSGEELTRWISCAITACNGGKASCTVSHTSFAATSS